MIVKDKGTESGKDGGNTPLLDKCWFCGGYITNSMMDMVRGVLANGYEMSDETILSICRHMYFYEDKEPELTPDIVSARLDSRLERAINSFQNNGGAFFERDDAVFVLNMLGYENYKNMSETVRNGGMVHLRKTEDYLYRREYDMEYNWEHSEELETKSEVEM